MKLRRALYLQVLLAMALGIGLGHFAPLTARAMQPLAEGFIKLIKLFVGPIIFVSIIHGVASLPSMREAGRIGGKAMLYFLAMSSLSLLLGLVVSTVFTPGQGLHIDPATLDSSALSSTPTHLAAHSFSEFMLQLIPSSIIEPFATTNLLQILFLALLTSTALLAMRPRGDGILRAIHSLSELLFTLMGYVLRLAPLAAFGAMATTVGTYGLASLLPLAKLLGCFYLTCGVFILGGLGLMLHSIGVSIWKLLRYLREEILITFATSSSESALPRLLDKLETLGCVRSVVSLVLPTGYSFNLDGTAIYLSLAALFLAQATDTPMTLGDQLLMLGVMMLTSKGAAGVAGAGFITLAATLSTMGQIPVAALTLILGIDRFMSEGRAVTNVIGNAVATLIVARWEGALDLTQLQRALTSP